jgi:hypothetical protein
MNLSPAPSQRVYDAISIPLLASPSTIRRYDAPLQMIPFRLSTGFLRLLLLL